MYVPDESPDADGDFPSEIVKAQRSEPPAGPTPTGADWPNGDLSATIRAGSKAATEAKVASRRLLSKLS